MASEHADDTGRPVAEFGHDAALEEAPFAYVAVDTSGALTLANLEARTQFGLTHEDLGRSLQDLDLSYRPVVLDSLIERARVEHRQVTLPDVEHGSGVDVRVYDVHVAPLVGRDGASVGTWISFVDVTRYRRLNESLDDARAKLETAFEELQSTAQELQTTNEELRAASDELRSTNEELETINEELRRRTLDLNEVNAFLESILFSLGTGVVVVDEELRVRTWNEQAAELWGLRPDVAQGLHLPNLDIGLAADEVLPLVRSALAGDDGDRMTTVETTNGRGRAIQCRISCSQLLSPSGDVRGVIVLMEDVRG